MTTDIREMRGVTADGTYTTLDNLIDVSNLTHIASITFFTDDTYTTPVVYPSAGTAQFEASEDGLVWGKTGGGTANDGLIDLTSSYLRPNLKTSIKNMRVTLSGVTGASHFIVRIASGRGA